MLKILRGCPKQDDRMTCIKKKKKTSWNKALTQTHPKAPAQKAQQGVSVRKCNRSTQPKNSRSMKKTTL